MESYKMAKDIASDDLYYIDGLESIRTAIHLMREKKVHALLIQKRNEADANGIVTISDIIKGVVIPDRSFDEVSVYEIMTKPVLSIPAHMNVKYVPRLMFNNGIRVAPVEENGKYIGLLDYTRFLFAEA